MNPKVKEVDRLSELPDQILIHILTFLPTLDAVRTMLLKPFGTLWTLLPNLDFDDTNFWYDTCPDGDGDGDDDVGDDDVVGFMSLNLAFFNFVRNVLLGHRGGKITKFRVLIGQTCFYYIYARNLSHEVDSWIDFALRKNVEILEFFIGMFDPDYVMYELPMTVFVNDSITEMKLDFLEINPHTRVQMGKLRVLKLERVDISDGVFQEIIRGCPSLKELEIYNCLWLNELCFDAPNVEKLILDTTTLDSKYYGLILDCPNLRVFQFTGSVNCIEVEDLSSLVDVTFNLEFEYQNLEFKEYEEFMAALKSILSAKVVLFSCEFVTVLFFCMQKHLPEVSMNWKRVELSVWLTEKHIPGLCRLLRKSPYLEELVIDVTSWTRDFLQPIESELDNCSIDNEEWSSSSLKRVVIYNISMCLYPILVHLVRNLLKNATVLAELRIYYKARDISHYEPVLSPEQWEGFSNELPTFSKASQHVKVLLF